MKPLLCAIIGVSLFAQPTQAIPETAPEPPQKTTGPKQPEAPTRSSLSPAHDYRDKYLELQQAFDEKLERLLKDLQLAYRPGNPDVWAVNAWEPYFKPTDDVPARLYNQFNADFLRHPEGRAWLKQRAAIKKQLAKTALTRITALRQHLQKMAYISPIPPEMN